MVEEYIVIADRSAGRPTKAATASSARELAGEAMSSRTPKPVAPLPTYARPASQAVPAMSRWAHGCSSTNSSRKEAA